MNILVTGGLGFIGRHLTAKLRRRGHNVTVCDLMQSGEPEYVRCDVREFRQVEVLLRGRRSPFDAVYHLAAEYGRWNGEDYYENLWQTNVIGTKHILKMQQRLRFRLIFFSSAEVYGDYDGVMTEDVPDKTPIRLLNDYAMTKWVGEMQCINSAATFGTETVRVRPVMVYGPREQYHYYRGVIATFLHKAMNNEPYTVHQGHKRIFDYVGDTVKTLANIAEKFKPGEVYNIGGREEWEVDIKTVSDIVLRLLGKDDRLVGYEETEPFTTRVKRVDSTKAMREIGHDPQVELEEGLRRTVEWALARQRINQGGRG